MTVAEAQVIAKWREGKDTTTIANEMKVDEAWVCKTIAAEQNRIYRARELARLQA